MDYVDVCTFPDFRLQPIEICAQTKKHVQVQKPISTNLATARQMIETARKGGILLNVVVSFASAIGRLGFDSIVQRDAPDANQGRAFAQFETRFQFGWVAAGVVVVGADRGAARLVAGGRPVLVLVLRQ